MDRPSIVANLSAADATDARHLENPIDPRCTPRAWPLTIWTISLLGKKTSYLCIDSIRPLFVRSEGGAGGIRARVPIKEMTIKPDLHPENEIARASETGPVCVGCYPHCRSNAACAIARREGKAKGGNKGKETRGLRTCRIRSELIGSDKSG